MNQKNTILIVDDEQVGCETLEALLLNQGYELIFAHNGQEALVQAETRKPDLILLDVMMPLMDGFQVCQKLRATPVLSEIPVIMVTALDDQDSRIRGIEAGADDFISKPFNRAELRARVRTITRLNRYRRILDERKRFEWVVEYASDGFVLVNEHDQILYANEQASTYLNLPQTSEQNQHVLSTDPFLTLVQKYYQCEPHDSWAHWQTDIRASTQEQKPARFLVRPETTTSLAFWLQVDIIDLPIASHIGHLIRMRDITEQMVNRWEIWSFHSMISHKLSTPLTAIINSLYLLKDEAYELTPQEIKEFSTIAYEGARRLQKQITEIRSYIKMMSISHSGEGCFVSSIESLLTQIAQEMKLETVHLSGVESLGHCQLLLSIQTLELILRELLENAVKFHPTKSPTIEIVVSNPKANEIAITVSDNGISLSPEQLAGVWTPYYQAEKGFSGEIPGMGLGLPMVASLLWSVGGRYHLMNRYPESGIVVSLFIPMIHNCND